MARQPDGKFLKGTGGRPSGSRNKLQRAFIEALAKDFEEHGAGVIDIVRMEKPHEYLKVVVSILPKEFIIAESSLDEMDDAEVMEALAAVRQARQAANGEVTH